jgi:hypothetical protein
MPFGTETTLKAPPHPATGTDTTYNVNVGAGVRTTAIGGAAVSDNVLNGGTFDAIYKTGVWITWVSDTDCYLHFQPSGQASTLTNASATNSLFLPAGVMVDFFHRPNHDDIVVVIQKTAAGRLYRWQSSL